MSAPLHPLVEYGVVIREHVILTCGPHTGHVFMPVAFCKDVETARLFAEGITALAGARGTEGHAA